MQHYKFGGSTAERTINCPGWVEQSAGLPRVKTINLPAQIGTELHNVMEARINGDTEPELSADASPQYWKADRAESLFGKLKVKHDLADIHPEVRGTGNRDDVGGTADVVAFSADGKTCVSLDWKFGDGIQVNAEGNSQGLFYLTVMATNSPLAQQVKQASRYIIVIIQPNEAGINECREWEVVWDDLVDFGERMNKAITDAESDTPPLGTGKHCVFCPASPVCPQKQGIARTAMMYQADDLGVLSQNLLMAKELKTWVSIVERTAHEQMELGCKVDGFKLVAKRAFARWSNPDSAEVVLEKYLGQQAFNTKLLSPAQAIKLIKSADVDYDIEDLIVRESSGTTVATADDKRAEVLNAEALKVALATHI